MKIAAGNIVRIEFELRVKGGDIIESSARSGPVQYVQGEGKLLPALEKRLVGLEAGATLDGEIPAAEAIPPEDTLPTRDIPRREFAKDAKIEVGAMFEAHAAGGGTLNLRVIAVDAEHVKVRLLPPLAGKDLLFKVKVMRIEDPVSHLVSVVRKPPPPLPGQAIELDVKPDEE